MGAEIYGQSVKREVECIFSCASHSKCMSVNYHVERKWCILNSKKESSSDEDGDNAAALVKEIGWRYFEKSTVRQL